MPDHEDSLGGETLDGENPADEPQQDISDLSLGDQHTFDDANVEADPFDDDMELVDLSIRYTEGPVLGKGGFGEVVLATDNRLNRKVAIKRIQGKAARSKTAVQRFLTEAKSIAALNHNNIVQVYDYGRSTDGPFLIMECVQGGSLLDKCKAGPIEVDTAIAILGHLCDGLAKAHAAGIIHRDIKPANILMTEDGVPKLTDFGLAKHDSVDTEKTMEGVVIGTPDFMPPEQRKGAEFTDHRSDLWSLAATFYQMLTGKRPKVINISLIPPKLQSAVAKALEELKEDRFQSVHEMRDEILQAHSGKMDTSRTLGEGECPQCGTRNPLDQKFCRECSARLQVHCLRCQKEIEIWNKACGQCGAQQDLLVDKALADLKKIHDQAEDLLIALEFDEAIEKARVLVEEKDSRLQQYAVWHEEFSTRLELSRTSEHARLEELLREATTHEQAYDCKAGLRTLSQIAPSLANTSINGNDTAEEVNSRLTTKQVRLRQLNGLVRDRVSKNQFTGLLVLVRELLKLKPDRPGVQNFKRQLEQRDADMLQTRTAAINQALQQLEEQEYEEAVAMLNSVSEEVSNEQLEDLKNQSGNLLNQLNNLRHKITTAVKRDELRGLLPVIDKSLKLKADQDDFVELRQKIIDHETRIDTSNLQTVIQAKQLMNELQFDEAVQLLGTIRQEYRTSTTLRLRRQIQALSAKRRNILSAEHLSNRGYENSINEIKTYLSDIKTAGIKDVKVQQILKGVEEKINRNKQLFKFAKPAVCVVAVAITSVVFGFGGYVWPLILVAVGCFIFVIVRDRLN